MYSSLKALHSDADNGNAEMPMMLEEKGKNSSEDYMLMIQEAKGLVAATETAYLVLGNCHNLHVPIDVIIIAGDGTANKAAVSRALCLARGFVEGW